MIALSLSQITKEYYQQVVFANLSFSVNVGDKLGLIGKNGTGKTTLLRLIAGIEKASSGNIYLDKNMSIGYMKQLDSYEDTTLIDFCLETFAGLIADEKRLAKMEAAMAQFKEHSAEFERFMEDYHILVDDFERKGGYFFRSKVRGILTGLGFSSDEFQRSIHSLSGGQLSRLKLARLLIDEPDILMLDEPTNHLDIKTSAWLETYLKQYTHTLLIVSHDRFFLDAVCDKMMELENGDAILYQGNYTAFRAKKDAMIKQRTKAYLKYKKERERQEEIIRRFKQRGTELLAKRAKSREKLLDKMTPAKQYQRDDKTMSLQLNAATASGKEVLRVQALSKSYDDKVILDGVSFNVFKGEKIGLIGDNGSGKSTLLKAISGQLDYDAGEIITGHNVYVGYYDQNQQNLNQSLTIFEEIHAMVPQINESEVRTLLGRFLFSDDEVFKAINVLSGGEKARVLLTKLFLTEANLLLLDEPTNHLDIYSKEVLETSLREFNGTVIAISHDRYFLNKICDKILEIDEAKATLYHGNYDYYIEKKAALNANSEQDNTEKSKTTRKQDRRRQRQKNEALKALKRDYSEVENKVFEIEMRLSEIDQDLCKIEVYSDPHKAKALAKEQRDLRRTLDDWVARWEQLAEALEQMDSAEP